MGQELNSDRKGITFPYKGVRNGYFVYHPAYHGPFDGDGRWEKSRERFQCKLDTFCDVCELYTDQQTLSESVGGSRWKRDVNKLLNAIEKEGKAVYELEALAEVIFDTDDKTSQRELPYHRELTERGRELMAEDSILTLGGGRVNPKGIIERSWGS